MICPVCKSECENEMVCANCGFDQLGIEFLNREEATYWMEHVVVPFREKWEENQTVTKIDWKEILFRQKEIEYFFNVTIPAAEYKNAPLSHMLLVCPYPRLLSAFIKMLEQFIPYRNVKRIEGEQKMKMGDIWAILTNLNEADVCVQKIKTIPTDAESSKHFQTALNGLYAEIQIGKGAGAREVRLDLPPFTFIAVANKMSEVPKVYHTLFENVIELKIEEQEACKIEIQSVAEELGMKIHYSAVELIATETNNDVSKSTNCIKHIGDYMLVKGLAGQMITVDLVRDVLSLFM